MNKTGLRVAAYLAVFVVTAVLTYIFAISDVTKEGASTSTMTDAGLPVVYMVTEEGTSYNYLHGYTKNMDVSQLRSVITPIGEDRQLDFVVRQYGCVLSGISYEVRDLTGEELIERTTLSDYQASKGLIPVSVKLKNLLTENEEYMLIVKLDTEVYGTVEYYSRIIMTDTLVMEEQLQYAMWFSECTRSSEDLTQISAKLLTDKNTANDNLGYVTSYCKLSQVGYAGLNPTRTSQLYASVMEYDGVYSSLSLYYTLESEDEERGTCDYDVWEYFRLNRVSDTVTYVNTYQRFMDQIYDPSYGVTLDGVLYLGIASEDEVERACSANGYVTAFVSNGNLWLYNAGKDTISKVFSFEDENSDGFREQYPGYGIRIISVENSGDVNFVVYGYMNRGAHEGACGLAAYTYSYATETVTELAFVESDLILEIMEANVDKLAYLSEDGNLYFYRNHTIYYVNCDTGEYVLVASEVNPDSMMRKGDVLLYQKGEDVYHSETIYLLYLEEGNTVTINAEEGTYVRLLGFIDDKIVYGSCDQDRVKISEDGIVYYPMSSIRLLEQDLTLVKDYSRENIFITDVIFYDTKLTMTRELYDPETGTTTATSSDELLSNMVQSGYSVELQTTESELRQTEYVLIPPVSAYCKPQSIRTSKYEFPSDAEVTITGLAESRDATYKVYGSGKLILVTDDLAAATQKAYDNGGTVCDDEGTLIWTRYKATKYSMTVGEAYLHMAQSDEGTETAEEGTVQVSTAVAAIDTMLAMAGYEVSIGDYLAEGDTWAERITAATGTCYDLLGNTVELSVFFTNEGIPLVIKTGEAEYELITGYTASDVTLMDMTSGQTHTMSLSNLNAAAAKYGRVILGIRPAE